MADETSGWRRIMPGAPPEAAAPAIAEPETPTMTTLDPGCEIEGTLTLDRSICIKGEFRGTIRCAETVTVTDAAAVQADIEARCIEIEGAVVGDVKAAREIVIRAGARLHGNIDAPCVVIERGAFFVGETRMYRPEAELRPAAVAAEV